MRDGTTIVTYSAEPASEAQHALDLLARWWAYTRAAASTEEMPDDS